MKKQLLLGDEAIARAAIDAGISGVFAYPGTPSTEITEYIQSYSKKENREISSRWASNEKTAMEAALGMSYIGKRALCCMKHVGMNVAADAFINSAMTGVRGGLVVVAADDPSMHSSQNEQDSRFYGDFAFVPMMEPSNQQEAYDMTRHAFDLSEKYGTPVLYRITTRLAHSRAGVENAKENAQNTLSLPENSSQFILLPALARKRYKQVIELQKSLEKESENSPFNKYIDGKDKKIGIVAAGIGYNYLMENFPDGCPYPVLKISQYPLPNEMFAKLADECESLLIVEEGYPFIENKLRGLLNNSLNVKGRLDGTLPRDGELTPDLVATALGLGVSKGEEVPSIVLQRPPALCQGCGHRDMYAALNEVVAHYPAHRVFGDIGCYTLGALPPFRAIHSCVDMGASITMAKGAADGGLWPAIAVIGDSTFTHSGMTGLLDCVNSKSNVTIVISDNETTGMTGGQDSAGTGKIEAIVRGLGVEDEHIRVFEPLKKNMDMMKQIIDEEIHYKGVSVIIPRRECIQTLKRKKK
ncbi:MAG: thiamine pyrophosphate-dependent enzyme [Bacteroidales bacterium]|nr:thiamine pyrophosphate-dependent enzyme [Bacteroidales bacterium]